MPQHRPTILLIRPYDQSVAFATELLAYTGLDVAIIPSPVLVIEPVKPVPKSDGAFALVFTSANGVRTYAASDRNRDVRAYCVGEATARAAREAGYRSVSANGDSGDLLELLTAHHMEGDPPYVYPHGEITAGNLAQLLRERRVPVTAQIVYRQVERALSDKAIEILTSRRVIVPLFSPNTARIFRKQTKGLKMVEPIYVCMSRAVAEELDGIAPESLIFAKHPSKAGMIAAISAAVSAK